MKREFQYAAIDFGRDILSPLVKEMDVSGDMPDTLIKQLFDQGVSLNEISIHVCVSNNLIIHVLFAFYVISVQD